ncbi:MAG: hypothetical protein Kow00129_15280 [Thermoleophilia bacterium]
MRDGWIKELHLNGPAGLPADRLHEAREFAREVAAAARLGQERTFDFTIAVSEAVANAVEHGDGGPLQIKAELDDMWVTLSVSHPSPFKIPAGKNRHGRGCGIPLMATLCDDLIMRRTGEGTTVVLRFRLH